MPPTDSLSHNSISYYTHIYNCLFVPRIHMWTDSTTLHTAGLNTFKSILAVHTFRPRYFLEHKRDEASRHASKTSDVNTRSWRALNHAGLRRSQSFGSSAYHTTLTTTTTTSPTLKAISTLRHVNPQARHTALWTHDGLLFSASHCFTRFSRKHTYTRTPHAHHTHIVLRSAILNVSVLFIPPCINTCTLLEDVRPLNCQPEWHSAGREW